MENASSERDTTSHPTFIPAMERVSNRSTTSLKSTSDQGKIIKVIHNSPSWGFVFPRADDLGVSVTLWHVTGGAKTHAGHTQKYGQHYVQPNHYDPQLGTVNCCEPLDQAAVSAVRR